MNSPQDKINHFIAEWRKNESAFGCYSGNQGEAAMMAIEKFVETLEAVVDPDMPNWTLEQERIGNKAIVSMALKEVAELLTKHEVRATENKDGK